MLVIKSTSCKQEGVFFNYTYLIYKSQDNLPTVLEHDGRLIDYIYTQCGEFNSYFSDIGKSINNSIINNYL